MQGFPTIGMPQPGTAAPRPWGPAGAAAPQGFPQSFAALAATSPSLGRLAPGPGFHPGTYPGPGPGPGPAPAPAGVNLPPGGAPPIQPMPGPSALGPGAVQGRVGTGVAGVGINPIASVTPPAASGGPHPLPTLPPVPLPQGFPNPFDLPQRAGNSSGPGGPSPFSPGTATVIGPQGYLPGLGYFGSPGQPGPQAQALPQVLAQARPAPAPVQTQPQQPQQPSPFWTALAWQMVNTQSARSAIGDRLSRLMEGEESRLKTIEVATGLLLSPELQNAFRAVASGSLQQIPFTALFADRLRGALDAAGATLAG